MKGVALAHSVAESSRGLRHLAGLAVVTCALAAMIPR